MISISHHFVYSWKSTLRIVDRALQQLSSNSKYTPNYTHTHTTISKRINGFFFLVLKCGIYHKQIHNAHESHETKKRVKNLLIKIWQGCINIISFENFHSNGWNLMSYRLSFNWSRLWIHQFQFYVILFSSFSFCLIRYSISLDVSFLVLCAVFSVQNTKNYYYILYVYVCFIHTNNVRLDLDLIV